MFLALILGIVHSSRSNVTLDMIKNLKNWFFKKFQICNFLHFFLSNFFMLLTISLVIFDLQKCAIPQIKARNFILTLFSQFFGLKSIIFERGSNEVVSFFLT